MQRLLSVSFERRAYRQPSGHGRPPQADYTPARAERDRPAKVSSTEAEWGVLCGTIARTRERVTRHKPKLRSAISHVYYRNVLSHGGAAPATVSG